MKTVEQWLNDNQLSIDIFNNKYRLEGESFDAWIERVSGGNKDIGRLIREKKFLFGGRILSNRGTADGKKITYSNCYVLPSPEDNLESIFDTAKGLARTFSYGGGCGIDIGKLAPNGATVNNAAKTSSGAVSFMDLYSLTTGLIGQSGRRGALMISIPISHPDVEDFIGVKEDLDKVTKANISIRITDDFMRAVEEDRDYTLSFTRETTGETITKVVRARELFLKLCHMNWDMGEPGLLFWDNIKQRNMLNTYDDFEFASVNPCAEEPLPAGGSCLLGSINLAEFVEDGEFLEEEFAEAVQIAVVALNEVLDEGLPLHPLQVQRDSVRDWRQIGLGIFGLADCLIKMGIRYGSDDAIDFCDIIGDIMALNAIEASIDLAKEHGAFPAYDYHNTVTSDFMHRHLTRDLAVKLEKYGIRNSQLLTCAPTGSISTMFQVSGGIEPVFAFSYTRKTESLHGEDVYYKVYTPIVQEYMEDNGLTDDANLPDYFVSAHELNYNERIAMQSALQSHIDASISSTINLPNKATVDDVFNIYMQAWKRGLKGVTVFREGCRRAGILMTNPDKKEEEQEEGLKRGEVIEASDNLIGLKRRIMSGCGTIHCEAFFDRDSGEFRELFLSKGSTGGCNSFMVGLSRMVSLAARGGIPFEMIIDQLNSTIACPSYRARTVTKHDTSKGACCPMAIGVVIKEMYNEAQVMIGNKPAEPKKPTTVQPKAKPIVPVKNTDETCPECGEPIAHVGGCTQCASCGWTKCD